MSARWPNTERPHKPAISVRYDTFEKLQRRAYRQKLPVSETLDRLLVAALSEAEEFNVMLDTLRSAQERALQADRERRMRDLFELPSPWVTCIKCGEKYSEADHVCLEEMELEDL